MPGGVRDYAGGHSVALIGLSVPHFWLGLMLILVVRVTSDCCRRPDTCRSSRIRSRTSGTCCCRPSCSAPRLAAVIMRQTRSAMLDSLGADYVRTARAKGLRSARWSSAHALRNSLITVVTDRRPAARRPDLRRGRHRADLRPPRLRQAHDRRRLHRDYPMIQGVVLWSPLGYIVINLLVDLLYSVLDPRIRVAGRAT